MTPGPPLSLPGGRVLAAWWRELADLAPRRLWFSQPLLHRVEALARCARRRPVDPFRIALLRILAVSPDPAVVPGGLQVDRHVLARMLRELTADGLLEADGAWRLTERGREALAHGEFTVHVEERRAFDFVDAAGDQPPRYLRLDAPPGPPFAPPEGWRFDPAVLETCVRESPEWKARHGFPTDVEAVLLTDTSDPGAAVEWRRVVLDRPELISLAFILTGSEGAPAALLGFAVEAEGWALRREAPVVVLGEGWREVAPDLAAEPPEEAWRRAWQDWCQPRGLSPEEAAACRLRFTDGRLQVEAPKSLVEHLREALKQEPWLLAGDGRTRAAARVEIVEREGERGA